MVVLAPASILPNTPDLPEVGINLTPVKPASCASFAMYSGPWGKFLFSAAIEGSAIQSCKRLIFAACILRNLRQYRGLVRVLGRGSGKHRAGTAASAAPETAPCTKYACSTLDIFRCAIRLSVQLILSILPTRILLRG